MLTLNDQLALEKKGITEDKIETQLNHFKNGFPFMQIVRPATPGDGLIVLNNNEINSAVLLYDSFVAEGLNVLKFVPASGAATRMFKLLYDALDLLNSGNMNLNKEAISFFNNLPLFPFAEKLAQISNIDLSQPIDIKKDGVNILKNLLSNSGMNYGSLPKGVLKFHRLNNNVITPVEEHMLEGALYCTDSNKHVHIHFTVSPEHETLFKKIVHDKKAQYEERFGINYKITFSQQKSSTDTVAVMPNNELFRQDNGALLFRPAGHGALIENLNDLHADVVFIKNIDNVVPEHLIADTINYKKALAGTLCKIRKKVFEALNELQKTTDIQSVNNIIKTLESDYNLHIPESISLLETNEKRDLLFNFLNRPIRVCGMVRNEGEPGGGPFWVRDNQGNLSLQIVESSQIDMNDSLSKFVMQSSTHFNPVDLVCGIKNYKGQKFDLPLYVDHETGFISEKSLNGKALRALELPGLWNGAMAHWLSIFVEVPLSTFNPVKTVNDLLRPQHQPQA